MSNLQYSQEVHLTVRCQCEKRLICLQDRALLPCIIVPVKPTFMQSLNKSTSLADSNKCQCQYTKCPQVKQRFTYLDRMAGGRATLYFIGFDLSYRPPNGFAAASMEVRAFKLACTDQEGHS